MGLIDDPAFICEWNRGPGGSGTARGFVFSEIASMANGGSELGRSPRRGYRRDSDSTRCLRSNQRHGLARFPGSAVPARKGVTTRGGGRQRCHPSPSRTGTGIVSAANACVERHVAVDGRSSARHKSVGSNTSRAHPRQHVPSSGTLASLSRSGVDRAGAPLKLDRRLDRAIEDAIAQARARAWPLVAQLPTSLPAIRAATARGVSRSIDRFTGAVIAKMVVICSMLRQITDS